MTLTQEKPAVALPGVFMLAMLIALTVVGVALILGGANAAGGSSPALVLGGLAAIALTVVLAFGFVTLQPNQAAVMTLLGHYTGTARQEGWLWVNPLTAASRRKVSLRIRNFDSEKLKVNDKAGNPVEIAAVVSWRVVDTARAFFDVDDFEDYVGFQSETAVRHLATEYTYDSYDEGGQSLSGNVDEVSATLQTELRARLEPAGLEVVEARLSHLSYAPEIAGAMLRRQQANAIVAARQRIVEGAVGMVEHALQMLERGNVVDLDEEKKAAMISNLLVVLTGEQAAQPVINAGTLYQ